MRLDANGSNHSQPRDAKSSLSVTSSSASSSLSLHQLHHSPAHNDVIQPSPSRRRRNSPSEAPAEQSVTSPYWVGDERRQKANEVDEGGSNAAAVPPVRRRAVDLSDLRSCALVQTQMKTRKPPASWRYVSNVFLRSAFYSVNQKTPTKIFLIYSGVFRNLKGDTLIDFQVHIFKSVQILAYISH